MKRPFETSICHQCTGAAYSGNRRGSVFVRCTVRPERYLPQPVYRCPQFSPKDARVPGESDPVERE